MIAATGAKSFGNRRQFSDGRLARRNFAVKNPQRILLAAPLAVFTQAVRTLADLISQYANERRPAFFIANRVDIHVKVGNADTAEEQRQHLEDFSFDGRIVGVR